MLHSVDEGRKRTIGVMATILAARKLALHDKPCPAVESAIYNAISTAEKIMQKIDERFPEKKKAAEPYKY